VQANELVIVDAHSQQSAAPLVANFLRGLSKEVCCALLVVSPRRISCFLLASRAEACKPMSLS